MTQWRQVQRKETITMWQGIQYSGLGADTVCEAGVGSGLMVVGPAPAAMKIGFLLSLLTMGIYASGLTPPKNSKQQNRMAALLCW